MNTAIKPETINNQSYFIKMAPPAAMIVSALLWMLAINVALSGHNLRYWLPVQFEGSTKIYALATDSERYDVVVIGSSVADRGLIPQVMEEELNRLVPRSEPWKVYNAAASGGSMPSSLETARLLGRRTHQPRLAILMMTTVNCNSAAKMDLMIKLYSTGPDALAVLVRAPKASARWGALNSIAHGLQALYQTPLLWRDRAKNRALQDWHGSTYHYPFTPENEAANAKFLPPLMRSIDELKEQRVGDVKELNLPDFSVPPLIDRWMEQLADELQRQGITLVITMAPESKWFVTNTYHGERDTSVKFLRDFARRRGLTFVDLNAPPYFLRDTDFYDGCDHLGPRGAEKLSRQLSQNLMAPLLSSRPEN